MLSDGFGRRQPPLGLEVSQFAPPFCDTCGHITVQSGDGYKCPNCGRAGILKVDPLILSAGDRMVEVTFTPKTIIFSAPADKTDPGLRGQLDLIELLLGKITQAGIKPGVTSLNLPEGDRPDRVVISLETIPVDSLRESLQTASGAIGTALALLK